MCLWTDLSLTCVSFRRRASLSVKQWLETANNRRESKFCCSHRSVFPSATEQSQRLRFSRQLQEARPTIFGFAVIFAYMPVQLTAAHTKSKRPKRNESGAVCVSRGSQIENRNRFEWMRLTIQRRIMMYDKKHIQIYLSLTATGTILWQSQASDLRSAFWQRHWAHTRTHVRTQACSPQRRNVAVLRMRAQEPLARQRRTHSNARHLCRLLKKASVWLIHYVISTDSMRSSRITLRILFVFGHNVWVSHVAYGSIFAGPSSKTVPSSSGRHRCDVKWPVLSGGNVLVATAPTIDQCLDERNVAMSAFRLIYSIYELCHIYNAGRRYVNRNAW